MTSVRIPSVNRSNGQYGLTGQKPGSGGRFDASGFTDRFSDRFSKKDQTGNADMQRLLRDLNKPEKESAGYDFNKRFTATSQNKVNGFLQLTGDKIDKELSKIKSHSNYKYKKVSSQILAAKNSVSAGKALLAAKRGVLEIRGKLSSGKGDSEELMIELSHAKRMEMAARKKKHHLELEEMVEKTQARDEQTEKLKDFGDSIQDAASLEVEAREEDISEQEDAIFEQRQAMMTEAMDQLELSGEDISEEAMAELNMMIADFGEEQLEQMEESMELLENMEIVDPHMSEDALERLKTRHRTSEYKQIAKADMEYIKATIKHIEERGAPAMPAMSAMSMASQMPVSVSIDISV